MRLDDIQVIMATGGEAWAARRADILRAAGAQVETCGPTQNLLMVIDSSPHHLTIIADTDREFPPGAVVRMLAAHDRRFVTPILVLIPPGAWDTVRDVAGATAVAVLDAETTPEALVASVASLVGPARAALLATTRAYSLEDALRARCRIIDEHRHRTEVLEHELRTPLGIVVGWASNLRDGLDGEITPTQKHRAEQIVKVAMRAGLIIDEALGQVRSTMTDQAEVRDVPASTFRRHQRTQFELGALVRDSMELFHDHASQRGVTLKLSQSETTHIWGDAPKLTQAVTNLITNALKFTPHGGEVALSVSLVDPDSPEQGPGGRRQAEIAVSDTGPGIPLEYRERIFEPGFRLERDQNLPGRGLGLAVCREIAQHHRGRIRVEDGTRGGARIVISLPLDLRTRARGPEGTERHG